ncbi:MAG: DNA-directed RNA polymerase subunit A' [Candidatus Aenigmatarchaeota archaeon]
MIDQIDFQLLSPTMVKKIAKAEITRPELYDNDGFPIEGGVMDPRLGIIDPGLRCRTCGQTIGNCFGHFGYVELVRPVIHVLYSKLIYRILRVMCNECSRIITTSTTTRPKKCTHCGTEQKAIKFQKPYTFLEDEKALTTMEVRERLEKIPDEDLKLLGFRGGRPEWLIITLMPVPPVITRPSITLETGERSEDDLTHKLVDIIRINQRLRENIDIGAPDFIIEDLWELLQYHVATFFDNTLSGIPAARHRSGRPLKTLADRLKSKEGRFRQNLAGKRVNFSARTVISPDPYISINEVGIPRSIVRELTIPLSVWEHNVEKLREIILNAPVWPSANYVVRPDGKRKKITEENKEEVAQEISPGYIIERHVRNGDIVLFNRQPSLHRMSIMAHRVRVTPWRTFTMNLCVCPPYNADFDGDEMNLHVLQTEEARAEARLLMSVQNHIRSPRFGGPIIGCEHDHVSGAYLLTKKETELSRKDAFYLLSQIGVDAELPSKKKISGKELFSMLLPKGLNMEFKAKVCGCEKCIKGTCPNDGYVVIRNGKLERGVIDKKAIGREAGKVIDRIEREYGTEEAHKFIDRVSLLGIIFLEKHGFTIGLDDIDLNISTLEKIKREIEKGVVGANQLIEDYANNRIEVLPGRDAKGSFEAHTLKLLANLTDSIGKIVASDLVENSAVVMAKSGARGHITHLAQLSGILGQQHVLGERIHRGFRGRTLSHFKAGDLTPMAHGFVVSAFKHGLNPFEFFFNVLSGREGLMDKSLRTRHSGYLERRLMNALQDLKVEYDGTIRDNRKVIIQFKPGEDGIDPAKSDWGAIDVDEIIKGVAK